VYLQPTIVLDKAELPELVHKEADAGPGRPYHFRERPLAYFRDDGFRPSLFAEVRQQQKGAG
jgi:hypothetical protein